MSSWATSDRKGTGKQKAPSSNTDPNKRSDPSFPRYMPPEATQYNSPIFSRPSDQSGNGIDATPEYESVPKSGGRSRDVSIMFVRTVPFDNLRACKEFIKDHPEVLEEPNLRAKYLDRAAQELVAGDRDSKRLAVSYMEKCTLIFGIKSYKQKKKGDFLELLINRDAGATEDYMRDFSKVKKDCEQQSGSVKDGDSNVAGLTNLALSDRHSESKRRGSFVQDAPYRGSKPELSREEQDSASTRQRPKRGVSPSPRNDGDDSTEPDYLDDNRSRERSTTRPHATSVPIYDTRFQQLKSRDWRYFKAGRVFAVKTYQENNSDVPDDFSLEQVKTTHGGLVEKKVRRMVVIKPREGFCLAVPINTYGGQGLNKRGLRENNINAHARIFMSDSRPTWQPMEPHPAKRDIKVEPEAGQRLHPASRVCFERTHSIDYDLEIMKIGTVTDAASLERLQEYWEAENKRPGGHGKAKNKPSEQREERKPPASGGKGYNRR